MSFNVERKLGLFQSASKEHLLLLEMLEDSGGDDSDYEGFDEDYGEDFDEYYGEGFDEDFDEDMPLDVLLARLEDDDWEVRMTTLKTLGELEPATLAQYADPVVARLEDSNWNVRFVALPLCTLSELEQPTLAQHAGAVVARLEDDNRIVCLEALETLGKLEPAMLAQHAGAVVARLEDSDLGVRNTALTLTTLGKLEPAVLAQHAHAVVGKLSDHVDFVREAALTTLLTLPLMITRDIDFESHNMRERLLGRIAWYRCLLRLRVRRIALYWYALPYRPSGPGHARDVEAWGQMRAES